MRTPLLAGISHLGVCCHGQIGDSSEKCNCVSVYVFVFVCVRQGGQVLQLIPGKLIEYAVCAAVYL